MNTIAFVLMLMLPAGEEHIGTSAVFGWDAVTQDVTGAAETIAFYEIAAFPLGTDLVANPNTTPAIKAHVEGTQLQAPASLFLSTLGSGTRLRVSVRAYDYAGNVSDWAAPMDIKIDNSKPKAPSNLTKIWPVLGAWLGVAALAMLLTRKKKKK